MPHARERVIDRARLLNESALTMSCGGPTIGARDDRVAMLVSTRDKFREALTLVSFRD